MRRIPKKTHPRIVWAVDPCGERGDRTPVVALAALRALAKRLEAAIEPVHVLCLGSGKGMTSGSSRVQPHLSRAQAALNSLAERARISGMLAPRIVMTGGNSNAACVRALARHAVAENADLIVVSSHQRRGVERLFLGSFAESLMLRTPSPLLIVNPRSKTAGELRRVLFPTDFSRASRRAFQVLVGFASRLGARVEVLHVVRPPDLQAGVYVMGPERRFPIESEGARVEAHKRAESLVLLARRAGVRASASVLAAKDASVSATILDAAKRSRTHMIALAAQSGAWRTAFVGSVTRQVVRGSPCPVLVLRGR